DQPDAHPVRAVESRQGRAPEGYAPCRTNGPRAAGGRCRGLVCAGAAAHRPNRLRRRDGRLLDRLPSLQGTGIVVALGRPRDRHCAAGRDSSAGRDRKTADRRPAASLDLRRLTVDDIEPRRQGAERRRTTMRKALVLMAVAGAMAAAPGARAEDDALLKLIEVLHDNGTISDEAYQMLIETASGPEATVAPTPTEAPAQPSYAGDDSPSADLEPRFSAGGRLHLDTARFDEDEVRFGNNSRVRRIRLETKVDVTDNWRASAAIEFADNEVDL